MSPEYKEKLLAVGMEAIAIRSVRAITLKDLAKELNITEWYLGKAHNLALLSLFQKRSKMHVNGDGKREVVYTDAKNEFENLEPEWMKNAQTNYIEPHIDVDFTSLAPTTDEKAYFYMRNKF